MFNLQGSEIVIVLLLALVVLGPEKLPDAMRKMGNFYAELKKMSSGFQSEFRAAIDEPMREVRNTADVLRDSADLTKLRNGEREEKPKSAEMPTIDDAEHVPAESVSDFDRPSGDGVSGEPGLASDSKSAPFSGASSAAPRTPSPVTEAGPLAGGAAGAASAVSDESDGASTEGAKRAPFSGRSSAAPREAVPADGSGPTDVAADIDELGAVPGAAVDDDAVDLDVVADVDDATGR